MKVTSRLDVPVCRGDSSWAQTCDEMCFMQVVPDQATNRLSFAYKLRCPGDAVFKQYKNLSANIKQVDIQFQISATLM